MAIARIALLNPNTDSAATRLMLEAARAALPPGFAAEGRTVPRGDSFIVDEAAYEAATGVGVAYGQDVAAEGFDGLVIAGFSDPGLLSLRSLLPIPVVGIAEAGIKEAGGLGGSDGRRRPYAIVAITRGLEANQRRSAAACGQAQNLVSIRFTAGEPKRLFADPAALEAALQACCEDAVREDGAEAILIGGGPLAAAANAIAPRLAVPLVEPVAAAMRRIVRELRARSQGPLV